ncbi:MAG: hypothetical protein M3N26_10040 [Pseudomonadota bacterium]|nr:hypothetical protein [Pseudomonadota bacterium]
MTPARGRSGEVIWLAQRQVRSGFTARDLDDLAHWTNVTRRLALWETETGSFAMLYADRSPWASWAVAREERAPDEGDGWSANGAIRLWNSITLVDVGRYRCMCDALAAIPLRRDGEDVMSYNVLPFRAAQRRGLEAYI